MNQILSKELEVFESHRQEWVSSHPGAFVVIQDNVVVNDFFPSYGVALKAGLDAFGVTKQFLIKQIWKTEPVYFVS